MAEAKMTAQKRMKELEQEGLNEPEVPELPESRRFRTTGFTRMPLDWKGQPTSTGGEDRDSDAMMIDRIKAVVGRTIDREFLDALQVLDSLYAIVRTQKTDDDGEPAFGPGGRPLWETNEMGMEIEDYSRLGSKERERFMYQITTRLFDWHARSVDAWAEAMFAKALWEDHFSVGYEELENPRATIEDRTARARLRSREERYFAIFKTYYSKQAEVLVKSFELLCQRFKDVHQG